MFQLGHGGLDKKKGEEDECHELQMVVSAKK